MTNATGIVVLENKIFDFQEDGYLQQMQALVSYYLL